MGRRRGSSRSGFAGRVLGVSPRILYILAFVSSSARDEALNQGVDALYVYGGALHVVVVVVRERGAFRTIVDELILITLVVKVPYSARGGVSISGRLCTSAVLAVSAVLAAGMVKAPVVLKVEGEVEADHPRG